MSGVELAFDDAGGDDPVVPTAPGEPVPSRYRLDADRRARDGHLVRIEQRVTIFDAAELAPESSFWASLLGGTVRDLGGAHLVLLDDVPVVGVQLAPGHVPPDWPDGTPQQVHTDLVVADPDQAHAEVLALGARVLGRRPDVDPGAGFQVYADPAGHPFCLCWEPTAPSQHTHPLDEGSDTPLTATRDVTQH